jgi:hypothetical protein
MEIKKIYFSFLMAVLYACEVVINKILNFFLKKSYSNIFSKKSKIKKVRSTKK